MADSFMVLGRRLEPGALPGFPSWIPHGMRHLYRVIDRAPRIYTVGRAERRRRTRTKPEVTVPAGNYLTLKQLVDVGPWETADSIERMRSRGILKKGIHWFQPGGRGSLLYFDRLAVERLTTGEPEPAPPCTVRLANGKEVRIDAEEERQAARLLP